MKILELQDNKRENTYQVYFFSLPHYIRSKDNISLEIGLNKIVLLREQIK